MIRSTLIVAAIFVCTSATRAANTSCAFDEATLSFAGSSLEQARCLLRPVKRHGELDAPLRSLPAPLEKLIGEPVTVDLAGLQIYLKTQSIAETNIGGPLTNRCEAKFFVIHDTSTPNYGDESIPTNINTFTWSLNNLDRYTNRAVAHAFVNRLGESITPHSFATPWRATKLEVRVLGEKGRGLFVHTELVQPRRRDPQGGAKNDALSPDPGFTVAQYDRLALLYLSASLQHGTWLVPGYHAAVDAGIPDAHDDPQNFDLALWARRLDALLAAIHAKPAPIPVILDTDIGDDIDDTWALALLLKSPELDLKLAVGDYGESPYRARLLAKFLERAGRSDVPVGIGLDIAPRGDGRQAAWVKDYDLKSYPGKVLTNGVQAIIDTVMNSPQPVTLICIGPVPNITEALKREPRIAQRARFVGMHGSVRAGYGSASQPIAEWNVKCDPKALQQVFAAPWKITITPLDTCGLVTLTGEKYQRVLRTTDRNVTDLITNYRLWVTGDAKLPADTADQHSSTLFDTVAVYLAMRPVLHSSTAEGGQDLCEMETIGLRVTDDGLTIIDPQGKQVNVATKWKDLGAFEDFLVERLTGKP